MSASREKKQRQDVGLDPKIVKAQKEQEERRRKVILYSVIGVIAALAVAALLIWNSGFFQARMTAATVGGENLTVAELDYYYYSARNEYLQYYSALGYPVPADTDVMDEESGQTYRDFYLETALDRASLYTALYKEAVSNGYSEDDVKDEIEQAMDNVKSGASSSGYGYGAYLKAAFGRYMNDGTLKKMVAREQVSAKYYSDHGEEIRASYTQDDLDAYLADHHDDLDTFEYSVFYVPAEEVETKDKDGNDIDEETVNKRKEEAMELAKSDAEEILLEFADGGDFDGLVEDFGLTASSCQDHAVNTGSAISSSLVYRDDLMGLKEGDSTVAEATNGYYAVVLHSRGLDESHTRDTGHSLINAETTADDEGNTVVTDEAWAAALEKIQAVLDEYNAGDKTEDSFAVLADKYSEDPGSNTNGGLYENVQPGDFVSEYEDWLFDDARQPGDVSDPIAHGKDTDTSTNYYGYHLIYYVGENESTVWQNSARSALASDDLTAWRDELTAQYPAAATDNAKLVG